MQREKFNNIILLALIFVTTLIALLHQYSLNHTLTIDTNTPYLVQTVTDKTGGNNGNSEATLTKNEDHFLLDCHIIASNYAWPFCEITVNFLYDDKNKSHKPIDLTTYQHAEVSATYINETNAGIRFQLRTFNPAYSTLADESTWKYNGIEYWPNLNKYPVKIPLNGLQVSTWWLLEREIPIEYSGPEFDQVVVLEIATGNNIPPGRYQLKIEKIEFVGKTFTNKQVYSFIISLWVIAAIIGLFINLKRSKEKLARSIKRADELKKLNRLLNVESEALKSQAERDPLTGALNRAGCEAIFTSEIKMLSIIFIDIDHFKPINDYHGHGVGDEILVEFVRRISENCRSTDFLARWGGEEFILICPNTQLEEAHELAESLRVMLSEHTWTQSISLTASFGVAQKGDEPLDQFIERADQALYAAKTRGRNRVVVSTSKEIDSSIHFE